MAIPRLGIFILLFCGSAAHSEYIVVIGDSHTCGSFGKNLFDGLTKAGNRVSLYCAPLTDPANWLEGRNQEGELCQVLKPSSPGLQLCGKNGRVPKLSDILNANKESRVVIALGTNSLKSDNIGRSYRALANVIQTGPHSC